MTSLFVFLASFLSGSGAGLASACSFFSQNAVAAFVMIERKELSWVEILFPDLEKLFPDPEISHGGAL